MNSEYPFAAWLEDYIHGEFKNLSNSINDAITSHKEQVTLMKPACEYGNLIDMIDKTIVHEIESLYDVIYDSILRCLPKEELP